MAERQLTCRTCGAQFVPSVRTQVYCSRTCKDCRVRAPRPKKPLAEVYICLACDKSFHPKAKDRTKFCGRACGLAFTGLQAKLRATGGRVSVRVLRRPAVPHRPNVGICCVCGKDYERTIAYQRCCGAECAEARREAARAKQRSSPSRRAYKKRRKAIERGAVSADRIDPLVVFDRDGWRCQICKAKTPRRLRGTIGRRAPELDHIVALANGGSHSYANTQCLCRECNQRKGATDYGQLHLFAAG